MAILSSEIIPKARLSAYERWELGTLEERDAPPSPPKIVPGAADLERQQTEASEGGRREGYAAGKAEGYTVGLNQAIAERVRLMTLIDSLGAEITGREQELADGVLDLALAVARKILDVSISARRESLRPVIITALEQLQLGPRRVRLCVNPEDVEVLRNMFANEPGAEHWQIRPDAAITIGGCRIESDQCEIDATVETRWARVLSSLGRSGDWAAGSPHTESEPREESQRAAKPHDEGAAAIQREGAQGDESSNDHTTDIR